ncbi:MAG: hypothetical protein JWN32_1905 [Solirubrobacterales bacterium]|nr:hypothetical protein [Solirubrobacterales bacterium]
MALHYFGDVPLPTNTQQLGLAAGTVKVGLPRGSIRPPEFAS